MSEDLPPSLRSPNKDLPPSLRSPDTDLPPSIYAFLAARVDDLGRLPDDVVLPDEEPEPTKLRWAPGALDGVLGHHGGADADAEAQRLAELVADAAADPREQRLTELLSNCPENILGLADPMIERLIELGPTRDGVHRVGRWLAATATERGPVKLGIALLGVAGVGDTAGMLRTLGAHDEFTLYAAVAFANGAEDAESEIWALAAVVEGWGRIHCVERLRHTTDPAIRRWILRTGFRNSVMNEYLAHIAATTGGLLEALRAGDQTVDRELLDAAGEILEALIRGGPAQDIDDWADAAEGVEAYLAALDTRAESLRDYLAVAAIRDFLGREDGWDERSERGWSAARRTAFERSCAELLGRPFWREVAAAGLQSPGEYLRWAGNWVLRDLGVDTFEHHVAVLRRNPFGGSWFEAWGQADGERAQRLVALAREVLPLDRLGSGAGLELGIGAQWADATALEWTLQRLSDHPGLGGDLLLVGLQSPIIRLRNISLQTLASWPVDAWPGAAHPLLADMARTDPDEDVMLRAREISQR